MSAARVPPCPDRRKPDTREPGQVPASADFRDTLRTVHDTVLDRTAMIEGLIETGR